MGLDTTHDCWSGSYTVFHRFRCAIATAIGIPLDAMEGFGGDMRWDAFPADPLHVLLRHSDCDGEIAVEDLLPLAERLEAVAGACGEWRESVLRFAAGCREAAAAGESVEFH